MCKAANSTIAALRQELEKAKRAADMQRNENIKTIKELSQVGPS